FTPDIFPKSPGFTTTDTLLNKFIGTRKILFQNGDVWMKHRMIANLGFQTASSTSSLYNHHPIFHRAMPAKLFGALTLKMYDEFEKEANFVNVRDMFHRVNVILNYHHKFALDAIGKAAFDFEFNV
ncbi:LOW QUALITY PROTEIN: hypothetical protein BC936DRAFT_140416, partial [Jimgerdemannia flammicorona]